jgi:hypothetical protein
VRSARRATYRATVLAVLALLAVAGLSGCQTTQEKATAKQAESKRILEKRERKRHLKSGEKGAEKK